jgi:hypothetical protein
MFTPNFRGLVLRPTVHSEVVVRQRFHQREHGAVSATAVVAEQSLRVFSLPTPNRVLPLFRHRILRDVRQPHPAGVIGRKPPDGSVIAQGEQPARGCADLDDRSHGSTATSGYFPSAFRTSVAITPTFSTVSSVSQGSLLAPLSNIGVRNPREH